MKEIHATMAMNSHAHAGGSLSPEHTHSRRLRLLGANSTEFPESLAVVGKLIAEPTRLRMLWALLDGRAYTAGELATVAATSPVAASMHLKKLTEGGLLSVVPQGRHRYFRFSDDAVAHAVEALGAVEYKSRAAIEPGVRRRMPAAAMKHARLCYGHLAGEVGVAVWQGMIESCWFSADDGGYQITRRGVQSLHRIGLAAECIPISGARIKPCMDWTERTYHLGGLLGRKLVEHWIQEGRLARIPKSRALVEKGMKNVINSLR
jgi:DNA-binding transcriptional ArsR family regulator